MATINRIEKCRVDTIETVRSKRYSSTMTRRYSRLLRANPTLVIPSVVDVATIAEYQIECVWGDIQGDNTGIIYNSDRKNCDLTGIASMIFLGKGEGTRRPNGSKIIAIDGVREAYAVLSWSDLFGHSIKESQLGVKKKDGVWVVYAIRLSPDELSELCEAIYQAGVEY